MKTRVALYCSYNPALSSLWTVGKTYSGIVTGVGGGNLLVRGNDGLHHVLGNDPEPRYPGAVSPYRPYDAFATYFSRVL